MNEEFSRARVNFGYSPRQADGLLEYLERQRVENGGRYRLAACSGDDGENDPDRVVILIYSHPWSNHSLKEESVPMCAFRLHFGRPGIDYAVASPNFDLETAWDDLAIIELAALGKIIHGVRVTNDTSPVIPP